MPDIFANRFDGGTQDVGHLEATSAASHFILSLAVGSPNAFTVQIVTLVIVMNKELLILRHGKSDWNVGCDDFKRPLKDRGKRGAQRLGVWMQQQDLLPDFVLSSPAERAFVTAEKLCKSAGLAVRDIYTDPRIYMANSETLKQIVRECPTQAKRVLLVGHNPGLEYLLEELVDTPIDMPEDGKLLPTATLAHLKLDGDFSSIKKHSASLQSITRASSLEKGFPYIGLNGAEFRPRPAYYYNQSAVIPYCIVEDELKFLLISASSKNRWGLPKGIVEPGFTPQASAAKEAWEEAGIEGVVGDESLGSYRHAKWGGVCDIAVYPMAVTAIIPADKWKESDRDRQWYTPKEAEELLAPELQSMIDRLLKALENYAS